MDPRERYKDDEETLRLALDAHQATMWTALPGIVQSFNAAAMTCSVQPAIQGVIRDESGVLHYVNLPLLLDCPVNFPSGGGYTLTFPMAAGDECLVVFSSRCIDNWWQQGVISRPLEFRMHDLSDGFVIPGCKSQPNALPSISSDSVQLRTNDGATYIEISPGGKVRISATDIQLHATNSWQWDVYGYGEKISYVGGSNYRVDNYKIGANVSNQNHPINPPDAT
jgi:hypothetical protein